MTRFVDVHILQDLPPSNINRDDSGSPKTCIYGGVERLRVSSQAWKRATRRNFEKYLDPATLGVRTRRMQALLTEQLQAQGRAPGEAMALAAAALSRLGIKAGRKEEQLSYLLFASRPQLAKIVDGLSEGVPEWASLKPEELNKAVEALVDVPAILGTGHSLDVGLFGRMVADFAQLNVDAACQVAHAVSTHPAQVQFDYFTAVDDEQSDAEPGAGMIGTVEFNSATVYRYATIAVEQLAENLSDHEAAIDGTVAFLRSFVESMPTGHQNGFAAHTRPALVAVVIREDQPVNLVSAFESPVRAVGGGFMAPSQAALADHMVAESTRWGDRPTTVCATYAADDAAMDRVAEAFGPSLRFDAVLAHVRSALEPSA